MANEFAAQAAKIASEAIDMFFEYRDQHGYEEEAAKLWAIGEIAEGYSYEALQAVAEMREWQERGEAEGGR
jgi:hypothetical protein